jgi:hypothetical protein
MSKLFENTQKRAKAVGLNFTKLKHGKAMRGTVVHFFTREPDADEC